MPRLVPLIHTITPRGGPSIPASQKRNLSNLHKATRPGAEERGFEPRSGKQGSSTGPSCLVPHHPGLCHTGVPVPLTPVFFTVTSDFSCCRLSKYLPNEALGLDDFGWFNARKRKGCYCLPGHFQRAHKFCFCSFFQGHVFALSPLPRFFIPFLQLLLPVFFFKPKGISPYPSIPTCLYD